MAFTMDLPMLRLNKSWTITLRRSVNWSGTAKVAFRLLGRDEGFFIIFFLLECGLPKGMYTK